MGKMWSMRIKFNILRGVTLFILGSFAQQGYTAVDEIPLRAKDPHFGEVLLYFYEGDYFSALTRLAAAREMRQFPAQNEDGDLLLGILHVSYGMNNEAKRIFTQLLADKNTPQKNRDIAALYLARIYHGQEALEESRKAFSAIGDALPARLKKDRALLEVNLLMAEKRYQTAEQALLRLEDESEVAVARQYLQHNLGVSMIKGGQLRQGINLLLKISEGSFGELEMRALQDKANLALAYNYLQSGNVDTSIAYFKKIRIDGPFSSKALLGLGLAETALKQQQRALIPLLELQQRDIREVEVQEALLMIPDILFKLESYKKSQNYYQNASSNYKEELDAISASMAAVRAGKMTRNILANVFLDEAHWNEFQKISPASPEARYFPWFIQNAIFQQSLSLYREAHSLRSTINAQRVSVGNYGLSDTATAAYHKNIDAKLSEIGAIMNKLEIHMSSLAIDWLEKRKTALDSYLSQAELGLAKVYHHAAERGEQ